MSACIKKNKLLAKLVKCVIWGAQAFLCLKFCAMNCESYIVHVGFYQPLAAWKLKVGHFVGAAQKVMGFCCVAW